MNRRFRDKVQHDKGKVMVYCQEWGYRPESPVGRLINHLRAEHRVKYGTDYRLGRVGKNRYMVVEGDEDFLWYLWRDHVLEHAAEFNTTIQLTRKAC